MNYFYYPGCSLKSTGKPYEESLLAVFRALETELIELRDWNCCGATAYMSVDELKAFTLSARNLAMALIQSHELKGSQAHVVAPCSECYCLLLKSHHYFEENKAVREVMVKALSEAGIDLKGLRERVYVRHPLDVLVNDIGLDKVKEKVTKPLEGLKVACYYGCLMVRPFAAFDDLWNPTSMDRLVRALGAEPVDWPLKTKCCGGTLSGTVQGVGMRTSYVLLREARRKGADAVITACPLCQFDLECFQDRMNKTYLDNLRVPVAYFTQLVGLAMGIPEKQLGMQRLFIPLPLEKAGGQGG